jgi:hypothetical protein
VGLLLINYYSVVISRGKVLLGGSMLIKYYSVVISRGKVGLGGTQWAYIDLGGTRRG